MDDTIERGLEPGRERAEKRWGEILDSGFTIVPDTLLQSQKALGLSARDMMVLLQIVSFWWRADEWPRPRVSTLASRLDVDERTVQRSISLLRDRGLIERTWVRTNSGTPAQGFELTGLVAKLRLLARKRNFNVVDEATNDD